MKEIKVSVVKYGQKYLRMRYRDPVTLKNVVRTAGTKSLAEAKSKAAEWQRHLNETGGRCDGVRQSWHRLFMDVADEYLRRVSATASKSARVALSRLFESFHFAYVDSFTPRQLAYYAERLRTEGYSDGTVNRQLKHIYAFFSWCIESGHLLNGEGPIVLIFRPRTVVEEGCVYFILDRESHRIKIGFTSHSDPGSRYRSLQTGRSTDALALLGFIRGTPLTERQLHKQFAYLRVRGEWFAATSVLYDYVSSLVTPS